MVNVRFELIDLDSIGQRGDAQIERAKLSAGNGGDPAGGSVHRVWRWGAVSLASISKNAGITAQLFGYFKVPLSDALRTLFCSARCRYVQK
jgi:hypothetical protein